MSRFLLVNEKHTPQSVLPDLLTNDIQYMSWLLLVNQQHTDPPLKSGISIDTNLHYYTAASLLFQCR